MFKKISRKSFLCALLVVYVRNNLSSYRIVFICFIGFFFPSFGSFSFSCFFFLPLFLSLFSLFHTGSSNNERNRIFEADLCSEQDGVWYCPNGCSRKYKSKGSLSRHLTYECGVPKKFLCKVCGRYFAIKNNLKTHMGLKHKIVLSL